MRRLKKERGMILTCTINSFSCLFLHLFFHNFFFLISSSSIIFFLVFNIHLLWEISHAIFFGKAHRDLTQEQRNKGGKKKEHKNSTPSFIPLVEHGELDAGNSSGSKLSLRCPLCRGTVHRWEVIEEARNYLNAKKRSCSRESCSFLGNYLELRLHARRVHPATRPSVVDPTRERAWQHFEQQREYGDIVSAIRSAIPGAVVVGDYVIENGDGRSSSDREGNLGDANGPWLTFLFQMIDSIDSVQEPRHRARAWTRHHRRPSRSDRRYLWGENLLGLRDSDRDVDEDASPVPRRRRRLNRNRFYEEQP